MVLSKNIKEYCQERKEIIKTAIQKSGKTPQLAIIQVGNNEASNRYVKNKIKDCQEVGIVAHRYWYAAEDVPTTDRLIAEIVDLQEFYSGIIVQLPLPEGLDVERIKMAIDPRKDVDGFHPLTKFDPCTPKGIVDYLVNGCSWNPAGKNVTIIGRSDIVGKPLAQMLTRMDATVSLCHSKTKRIDKFVDIADLVVVAVGKAKFLNCYPIYVPIVDVGINFNENGKLVGDCYNTEDRDVTPVPGGVGLLTRLALLENTCIAGGIDLRVGLN